MKRTESAALHSYTDGKAFLASQFGRWAPVPEGMQADIIGQIRKRRGLDQRPPSYEEFFEKE